MRGATLLVSLMLLTSVLPGCLKEEIPPPPPIVEPEFPSTFVTGADGLPVDEELIPMSFTFLSLIHI